MLGQILILGNLDEHVNAICYENMGKSYENYEKC